MKKITQKERILSDVYGRLLKVGYSSKDKNKIMKVGKDILTENQDENILKKEIVGLRKKIMKVVYLLSEKDLVISDGNNLRKCVVSLLLLLSNDKENKNAMKCFNLPIVRGRAK